MKLLIQRKDLLKKLTPLVAITPNRSVKPIAECIKLDLVGNTLTLFSTDLTISMSCIIIDVEGKEDGSIVIPAKKFFQIIKEMPETQITLSLLNGSLKISAKKLKFNLPITEDVDSFPTMPEGKSTDVLELKSSIFKDYIEKTVFATSNDDLRPVLTGVLLSVKNDYLTMVATDSIGLVKLVANGVKYSNKDIDIIIPAKTLRTIANSLTQNDIVEISFEDGFVICTIGTIIIYSRLVNGRYPAYNAIIPVNNETKPHIYREELLKSLKSVGLSCSPITGLISIHFDGDIAIIASEDNVTLSSAEDELTITDNNNSIKMGFNIHKLTNILNSIDSDIVEFQIGDENKPVLIKPITSSDTHELTTLIMPVKVN